MGIQYINFFSVFIVTFFLSALLGRKNPIIVTIGFSIFLIITAFFIDEFGVVLIWYITLGLISCFSWSVFFRWLLLKDLWAKMIPNSNFFLVLAQVETIGT